MDNFLLSGEEMDEYKRRFDGLGAPNGIGGTNHPNCKATFRFGETLDSLGLAIPVKSFTLTFGYHIASVRKMIWKQHAKGRDYVSITAIAKALCLTYDQVDNIVTQLHAERKIPRTLVVEEMEG